MVNKDDRYDEFLFDLSSFKNGNGKINIDKIGERMSCRGLLFRKMTSLYSWHWHVNERRKLLDWLCKTAVNKQLDSFQNIHLTVISLSTGASRFMITGLNRNCKQLYFENHDFLLDLTNKI